MSLIKSLKSKLLETKNDLSDSLSSNILNKNFSESNDFGFDILFRYKFNWNKIHKENEQLSKSIQKSEVALLKICAASKDMHDRFNQLHSNLSDLAQISVQINSINSLIDGINVSCSSIEKSLVELEDQNEELNLISQKELHNNQLITLSLQKQQELQEAKSQLDKVHMQSVKQKEVQDAAALAERQKVFAEAHEQLMQEFKNTGTIYKRDNTEIETVDLSQMTLDDDRQELESFLEDDSSAPPT